MPIITPLGISRDQVAAQDPDSKIIETREAFNQFAAKEIPEKYKEQITFDSFKCHCGCGQVKISPLLIKMLIHLQDAYGDQTLSWGSAYRCPIQNALAGGAKNSFHMQGRAVDFGFKDKAQNTPDNMKELAATVQELVNGDRINQDPSKDAENWWGGLGWYDSWVHMDTRRYKYYYHTSDEIYVNRFDGIIIQFTPRFTDPKSLELYQDPIMWNNPGYVQTRIKEYYSENSKEIDSSIMQEFLPGNGVTDWYDTRQKNNAEGVGFTPLLGAIAYWKHTQKKYCYVACVEKVSTDKKTITISSVSSYPGVFELNKISCENEWNKNILPPTQDTSGYEFKGFIYPTFKIQGTDGEGAENMLLEAPETVQDYIFYYILSQLPKDLMFPKLVACSILANIQYESECNPIKVDTNMINQESYTGIVNVNKYKNFAYDEVSYGLAQYKNFTQKRGLENYAKQQKTSIGNIRTQLDFILQDLQTYSNGDIWKRLIQSTTVVEAANIAYEYFRMPAKEQSSTIFAKIKNNAIILEDEYELDKIALVYEELQESIETEEIPESVELKEKDLPEFTSNQEFKPTYKSLKNALCKKCGQFYLNCQKDCNPLHYANDFIFANNKYAIYYPMGETVPIFTHPQYLQKYSKTVELNKIDGIIFYYTKDSLDLHLVKNNKKEYNHLSPALLSAESPTRIPTPFHFCIGRNVIGDFITINTYDLSKGIGQGGNGSKGTCDNNYLHVLICGELTDALYAEIAEFLLSVYKFYKINNKNYVMNNTLPQIITIDEAVSMGYAINSDYSFNNSQQSWNKIINQIRNMIENSSTQVNTTIYYVYDYNPIYSAPMLISQYYDFNQAEKEASRNTNYGVFIYGENNKLIQQYPTDKELVFKDSITLGAFDRWGDNTSITDKQLGVEAYKKIPITKDNYDGYFVIQLNSNGSELGLIKLASR